MFKWLFSRSKTPKAPKDVQKFLDPEAVSIVQKLQSAGFETYLVGGCVRDILLGKKPKDFDIATKATPQQVKSQIHRSFIIGRRFRIVVAKRRDRDAQGDGGPELFPNFAERPTEKEFQITTFRRDPVQVDGQVNENVFGTAEEDATRRDFTLNALFLDPVNGKIHDFVGGLDDLNKKRLKVIGDPETRFREDPIRILRALRFMARANLKLDSKTEAALNKSVPHLAESKRERMREEILKILREGAAHDVFEQMARHGLWKSCSDVLHLRHKESHDTWNRIGKSLAKNPWRQTSQAPLFYLFLFDLLRRNDNSPSLNQALEDLKVSRAERDDMIRIQQILMRVDRDPKALGPQRILTRVARNPGTLVQAFFVLKVVGDAGIKPFDALWKAWETPWKDYVASVLANARKHSPRERQHSSGNHRANPNGPSVSGARRSRGPRPSRSRGPRSPAASVSASGGAASSTAAGSPAVVTASSRSSTGPTSDDV